MNLRSCLIWNNHGLRMGWRSIFLHSRSLWIIFLNLPPFRIHDLLFSFFQSVSNWIFFELFYVLVRHTFSPFAWRPAVARRSLILLLSLPGRFLPLTGLPRLPTNNLLLFLNESLICFEQHAHGLRWLLPHKSISFILLRGWILNFLRRRLLLFSWLWVRWVDKNSSHLSGMLSSCPRSSLSCVQNRNHRPWWSYFHLILARHLFRRPNRKPLSIRRCFCRPLLLLNKQIKLSLGRKLRYNRRLIFIFESVFFLIHDCHLLLFDLRIQRLFFAYYHFLLLFQCFIRVKRSLSSFFWVRTSFATWTSATLRFLNLELCESFGL